MDIGHEHILGAMEGGIDAWTASGRPVARIPVVDIEHLAPTIIDVRQANEYVTGHVPGARNVELAALPDESLPNGQITMMCGHGERAMTAASLLVAAGRSEVSAFDGGPETWSAVTGGSLEIGP
jgi:Rhodanese-related sulfurtransferase